MSDPKLCPYCQEEIKAAAIKCKHCKSDLLDSNTHLATNPESSSVPPLPNISKATTPKKSNNWIFALLFSIIIIWVVAIAGSENNKQTPQITPNVDAAATDTDSDNVLSDYPIDIEAAAIMVTEAKDLINDSKYYEAETVLTEAALYDPDNPEITTLLINVEAFINQNIEKEFRENSITYEYRVLDRDAETLIDKKIKQRGKVLQIMVGSGLTSIRLAVTESNYGWSASDVIYITYFGDTDIYKDDIVTFYGTIIGFYTYESTAGYNITIPHIHALYYDSE